MAEALTILGLICSSHMIMFVPLLIIVGYLLKHYTTMPNKFIPFVETGLGMAIGVLYAVTGRPEENIVTGIIMYAGQGIVLGFSSIAIYDALHGTIGHKCKLMEESMEEKEKKKFNPFDHSAIVYGIAIVGSVVVCGLIEMAFHGVEGMLNYLLNYAHYNILTCIALDIMSKVASDRKSIVWQYWVMVALIARADVCYVVASVTTTFLWMWVCIGGTVTLLASSLLFCKMCYEPAVAKKKEEVLSIVREDLIEIGVPESKVEGVTNYFFN